MSDNEVAILIVIVLIAIFLIWIASKLIIVFTLFALELPLIISIPMFILFPPTFIVFLIGLFLLMFTGDT